PLKPGTFGRKRHEFSSPNLGGHLRPHPLLQPCLKAHGNELRFARIIEPPFRAHLLSDLRNSPPLKSSEPPQTGLLRY
ncbi:hypothetical protein AVEN_79981-1, partial [Araneus ventricosus]